MNAQADNSSPQTPSTRQGIRRSAGQVIRAHFVTCVLVWMLIVTILAIAVLVSFINLIITFSKHSGEPCDQSVTVFIWINIAAAIYYNTLHLCIVNELNDDQDQTLEGSAQTKAAFIYESLAHILCIFLFIAGLVIVNNADKCEEETPRLYNSVTRYVWLGFMLSVCWLITSLSTVIFVILLRNHAISTPGAAPSGTLDLCQSVTVGDETSMSLLGPAVPDIHSATCSICLEASFVGLIWVVSQGFSKGDEIKVTPCNHVFHTSCITGWFRVDHTCPMCRFDISGGETERDVEDSEHTSLSSPRIYDPRENVQLEIPAIVVSTSPDTGGLGVVADNTEGSSF